MSNCPHGINVMNHRCDRCEEVAEAEHRCAPRRTPAPPAEPDSGVQDKEICFCGQLIAKHDQSHNPRPFKEVLGEQKKRVCSLCGVRFGEDVKVCPTDGHPIISVLTDAPADPPAEPDSGIQEQTDLVEEFKRNHHNPIVANLNRRIRELEEKDAPADHVEHV